MFTAGPSSSHGSSEETPLYIQYRRVCQREKEAAARNSCLLEDLAKLKLKMATYSLSEETRAHHLAKLRQQYEESAYEVRRTRPLPSGHVTKPQPQQHFYRQPDSLTPHFAPHSSTLATLPYKDMSSVKTREFTTAPFLSKLISSSAPISSEPSSSVQLSNDASILSSYAGSIPPSTTGGPNRGVAASKPPLPSTATSSKRLSAGSAGFSTSGAFEPLLFTGVPSFSPRIPPTTTTAPFFSPCVPSTTPFFSPRIPPTATTAVPSTATTTQLFSPQTPTAPSLDIANTTTTPSLSPPPPEATTAMTLPFDTLPTTTPLLSPLPSSTSATPILTSYAHDVFPAGRSEPVLGMSPMSSPKSSIPEPALGAYSTPSSAAPSCNLELDHPVTLEPVLGMGSPVPASSHFRISEPVVGAGLFTHHGTSEPRDSSLDSDSLASEPLPSPQPVVGSVLRKNLGATVNFESVQVGVASAPEGVASALVETSDAESLELGQEGSLQSGSEDTPPHPSGGLQVSPPVGARQTTPTESLSESFSTNPDIGNQGSELTPPKQHTPFENELEDEQNLLEEELHSPEVPQGPGRSHLREDGNFSPLEANGLPSHGGSIPTSRPPQAMEASSVPSKTDSIKVELATSEVMARTAEEADSKPDYSGGLDVSLTPSSSASSLGAKSLSPQAPRAPLMTQSPAPQDDPSIPHRSSFQQTPAYQALVGSALEIEKGSMDFSDQSSSVSADIEKELMQVLERGVASGVAAGGDEEGEETRVGQGRLSGSRQEPCEEEEEEEESLSSSLSLPKYVPTIATTSPATRARSIDVPQTTMAGTQPLSKTSLNSSLKRRLGLVSSSDDESEAGAIGGVVGHAFTQPHPGPIHSASGVAMGTGVESSEEEEFDFLS